MECYIVTKIMKMIEKKTGEKEHMPGHDINFDLITREESNKLNDDTIKREKFICDVYLGINEEKNILKYILIKFKFLRKIFFKIF